MKITWFLLAFATSSLNGQDHEPELAPGIHAARKLPVPNEFKEGIINNVVEESTHFVIKNANIEQWHRLRLDEYLYLLGVAKRKISLVTVSPINNNKYQVLEYLMDVPYNISSAVMFESPIPRDGIYTNQGVVLLGLMSPEPTVDVFKIKNFKLVKVAAWKREMPIQAVAQFKRDDDDDKVIIVEDWDPYSRVHVYGMKFEKPAPHYWHLETLVVDKIHGQLSIGNLKNGVFLALIKSADRSVQVYSYKSLCAKQPKLISGGKFELLAVGDNLKAKKTVFFHAHGQDHFMLITKNSDLFVISEDGSFQKAVSFARAEDMMIIPVVRDDVILMGKTSNGEPHFYTYDRFSGSWSLVIPTPKCRRSKWSADEAHSVYDLEVCIGANRSWDGATFLGEGGYPSILFADRKVPGELYHLTFTNTKVASSSPWTGYFADELELILNRLRSVINEVSSRSSVDDVRFKTTCSVYEELDRLLTEGKRLLGSCAHESARQIEREHNIVFDESKPQETITEPTRIPSDSALPSQDLTSAESAESSTITSSQALNDVTLFETSKTPKNTPISPDMNNLPVDYRDAILDRMGEVVEAVYHR